jgi:drug/metabolite transporter (DMT)-like permease
LTASPRSHLALALGLVLVSTSGPFIHMAGLAPMSLVFWRMGLAGPLFLTVARAVPAEHRRRLVIGALLLTAHFLLWVKAFDLTSYASNLILLVAQPIMGALASARLGEAPSRGMWTGVTLAFVGLVIIAGGDVALGPLALLGDAMCVLGGLAITAFYVVTGAARRALALPAFMGWTFVIGAAATLPIALLAGRPLLPAGGASWGWVLGLVVITTMAGHGLMNLAARGVSIFTLNFVIVLEPPLAIVMGAALWGARISWIQGLGGLVLSVAVVIGLRRT